MSVALFPSLPLRPALAALAALALAACTEPSARPQEQAQPKPARPVLVETVNFGAEVRARTLVGVVRPRTEGDLGFRVGGKLTRRLVDVGQQVAKGDPLAELDPGDLGLQRAQAEAEQGAARAALSTAEHELARVAELRQRGWSTEAAADRQRLAVEEARGRLERAVRALALAENAYGYARLEAPTSGVITATPAEPGQVLAAGQVAVRLAHDGPREVLVNVPEALVEHVRSAQARVALWSDPGTRYAATLRELSPAADPATRTYAARFALDADPDKALIGMSATLTLDQPAGARVARLPLSALFDQGRGPALWVVDPATGALTLRPVEVVAYQGRDVLIAGGVKDGEKIVTLGVQKLDAGQTVRIVDADTLADRR